MITNIVVDIGNSRMKWGQCDPHQVTSACILPLQGTEAWQQQLDQWQVPGSCQWSIASVNPAVTKHLSVWLRKTGFIVFEVHRPLPLSLQVENPTLVGIDRLLNALAANSVREKDRAALIVDAGSAVTVDWVDESGTFRGGAIFPGIQLMYRSLHQSTAGLPLVDDVQVPPAIPGTTTTKAIAVGVYGALVGGIEHLLKQLREQCSSEPVIYITGGDASLLQPAINMPMQHWPNMTLEGLRIASQHQHGT